MIRAETTKWRETKIELLDFFLAEAAERPSGDDPVASDRLS